jgi:hypothetical protein
VGRVINSKVVGLLILYHFHKGCIAFFSTIFAQIEFKVFRRNLENATKVPADIGGQRGVQGF